MNEYNSLLSFIIHNFLHIFFHGQCFIGYGHCKETIKINFNHLSQGTMYLYPINLKFVGMANSFAYLYIDCWIGLYQSHHSFFQRNYFMKLMIHIGFHWHPCIVFHESMCSLFSNRYLLIWSLFVVNQIRDSDSLPFNLETYCSILYLIIQRYLWYHCAYL